MVALSDPRLVRLTGCLAPKHISALAPLPGGAPSLTYLARCAGRPVVVKVAPPGVRPIAHRDGLQQARAIPTLARTGVPVPEVLLEGAGDPTAVPSLFVMRHADGTSCEPLFDDADGGPEAVVAARFQNAAAVMAQLHLIQPAAAGVESEPVVGPSAEVER